MSFDWSQIGDLSSSRELEVFLRSDFLREWRSLLLKLPALRPLLEQLLQVRAIIDASIIQAELRWRLAKRVKSHARSDLTEAMAAGVVVAFAPSFLMAEIEGDLARLACETRKNLAQVIAEWNDLKRHICFYRPVTSRKVVIDAKIIRDELRRKLCSSGKPDTRSGLLDAIASGVVLMAPVSDAEEIDRQIDQISASLGVSPSETMRQWQDLQAHINFVCDTPEKLGSRIADIDDLPYQSAYEELDAVGVYSADPHLSQMNMPVISISLCYALREHARSSSVVVQVFAGSTISAGIGFAALRTLFNVLKIALQAFRRLPPIVQISIAGVAAGFLINTRSRQKIVAFLKWLYQNARELTAELRDPVSKFVDQFFCAVTKSEMTRQQIQSALPRIRRRTAIMHARAVCLASRNPLSVAEIELRMRAHGYVSRSMNFSAYLRRLLRANSQFIEAFPGMWRLQQG